MALATPRRSTRGAIFTPSPHPTQTYTQPNTTYAWTSAPIATSGPIASSSGSSKRPAGAHASSSSSTRRADSRTRTNYNSFTRIVHSGQLTTPRKSSALTPGKKARPKAGEGDKESRFHVGDGVMVGVDGGDGVGILVGLYEEEGKAGDEDDDDENEDEDNVDEDGAGVGDDGEEEEKETRMMAEVHWCFRRKDLPGVMKNLSVEDNEVLLAASPIRPVTTHLPISLLQKTIPIYSRVFFNQQFQYRPTKSSVKGWTYVRQGVYWCEKAFDKGARGGKVWKVDVDAWREGGKRGGGWEVPLEEVRDEEEEEEPEQAGSSDEEGSEHQGDGGSGGEEGEDGGDSGEAEGDEDNEAGRISAVKKRKRTTKPSQSNKRAKISSRKPKGKRGSAVDTPSKPRKRTAHPKSSTSHLPTTILPEDLPTDPYQRALRLLHVGATPESLPCREEEFVDVLGRVEEGVESGGGGCLYIAGVPGTGKTATVHAVVKELKRKAEDGELPPFSYVEINGLKIPSPQHAYTVLWEAISGVKGCSSKTALRGLEGHFGRKTTGVKGPRGHTFVVLMDELDQLLTAKQDVVYNFFNWPTMRDSQLFVIAVANRMDLPQHLAAKIKSRLGLQTILFQPYDRTSLIEIVQSRLIAHPKSTDDHKVLMPDAIALAATRMAGTNGDARRVLDACRRAVEVALEQPAPHPVNPKEMMQVLNQMSSSPVAMFVKSCSVQQKLMMAAVVRCVRREGVAEIAWRSVRSDHDALTRSLLESTDLLSPSELQLIFSSLLATHALTGAHEPYKAADDRRVALGMEISEVGRVLMAEGEGWRRALAGT